MLPPLPSKEINSSKIDINESINSRKERINNLLSMYGKPKTNDELESKKAKDISLSMNDIKQSPSKNIQNPNIIHIHHSTPNTNDKEPKIVKNIQPAISTNQNINKRFESSLKKLELSTQNLMKNSIKSQVPKEKANFKLKSFISKEDINRSTTTTGNSGQYSSNKEEKKYTKKSVEQKHSVSMIQKTGSVIRDNSLKESKSKKLINLGLNNISLNKQLSPKKINEKNLLQRKKQIVEKRLEAFSINYKKYYLIKAKIKVSWSPILKNLQVQ